MLIGKLKRIRRGYSLLQEKLSKIDDRLEQVQQSIGRVEQRQSQSIASMNVADHEYKVYSQWGEDGIIQFLIEAVGVKNRTFVEFGVEDYSEANTRNLLHNANWSGLVIDGSEANTKTIKASSYYWKYNLKVEHAFISAENINDIIEGAGLSGEIGLLSVDIDGNDYWVWRSITSVTPDIVVVEYNSRLGSSKAITVPYDPAFERAKAHYSMIYFGASLRALAILGEEKGYDLVGCSSSGINAFFVKKEKRPKNLPKLTVEQAFVESNVRESRNELGEMTFLNKQEEQNILKGMKFVEIKN